MKRVFSVIVVCTLVFSVYFEKSHSLTCQESGTPAALDTLPTSPDSYMVDVEANIVDKGYTAEVKFFYSYTSNAATLVVFSQGAVKRYIYSYYTDEIFTISGTDCSVKQLTASHNIYSTWLLGFYRLTNGQLHIQNSQWWVNFQFGKDYGELTLSCKTGIRFTTTTHSQTPAVVTFSSYLFENYIGNITVRGVRVDHWQSCGKWKRNKSMLIDYYFSGNWSSASTFPRVPVRIEVKAEDQLANGSLYNIHHVYDFFNFRAEEIDGQTVFQTPVGVTCPGRMNTKQLPQLPQRFYVRSEIIYSGASVVTYEDVWYDGAFKYYRRDYRPLTATYPTFSFNPLTEIHDYYIGARYVIDKGQGNCSTLPLSNTSMDVEAENRNGSYIIHLRNPLQLFHLDWNYTYIGQVFERGMLCDVYATMRTDLLVSEMIDNYNTTITVYFLAPEWDSYDSGALQAAGYAIPVKMILQDDVGQSVTYNYVEFAIKPLLNIYDISTCYPEAHKLTFQVRFQGRHKGFRHSSVEVWSGRFVLVFISGGVFGGWRVANQAMLPYLTDFAYMAFAQQLGVSFLRIQHINFDYDDAYTYVSATLLDKTPPTAQFEYIPGKVIEKHDDSIVYKIYNPFVCASYCINNQAFICNSFDFCADDHTCRLSRAHIGDGTAVLKTSSTCDHFSRSVNGIRDEPTIYDAFRQLRMKVYNHTLNLPLSMGQHLEAIDVSVTFGWLTTNVKLPKIAESFHYRIEGTIPALRYTYEGEVWYDKTLQLIRYDSHYSGPISPYSTNNPLSMIDDFSTGLQYVKDRVNNNCTIQAIPETDFGAILSPQGQANSTWSLRMKTQYELLHIDTTYRFVGQQTVRGVLCNVFESQRTDYNPPGVSGNHMSVFKYFFLAKDWYEVSEESGGAHSQPVRLEITISEIGVFIEYNIFDFNSDRPDVSIYDIHDCFDDRNQQTFQITFPGPYHPYLDTKENMLRLEATFAMARITTLPPLRFQRTRVDYDRNNVYVTTSMVGNTAIAHYFTHIINGSVAQHTDSVMSIQGPDAAEHCAQICYEGLNFTCNSFFVCASQNQCLFSSKNAPSPSGPKPNIVPGCESYSRTVTSRAKAPLSPLTAMIMLKNTVYRRKLNIVIPGPGVLEPFTYSALKIRTDILQGPQTSQNVAMQHFSVAKNNSKTTAVDSLLNDMSVDDCALACTSELDFQCLGFVYCDDMITCGLLKTRPDQMNSSGIKQASSCFIYERTYLDDYLPSPGVVAETVALSTVPSVSTADCAKTCTQESTFLCKSFEFCGNTKRCLLFSGRSTGNATSGVSTTCHQYTRNYLVDFQSVSSGKYVFISVVQFLGVSVSQCAKICIDQQGVPCHGFYFCQTVSTCHLTSAQPGQAQVVEDHSDQAIFCTYYSRLGDNGTSPFSTQTPTVSKVSSQSSVSVSASKSSTGRSSSNTFSTTATSPSTTDKSKPNTISTTTGTKRDSVSSLIPTTTHAAKSTSCIGSSPQHQTSDSKTVKTGTVVGVAFATFILGLLIGVAALFVFNRMRLKSHEEIEMHITKHEHS